MKRIILLGVVVGWLADARTAQAQFGGGFGGAGFGGAGFGGGFASRSSFSYGRGFSYHHSGFRVAGFASGYYSRSVFAVPVGPFGFGPNFGPGYGSGFWGVGSGFWGGPPTVIVIPPPIILAGNGFDPNAPGVTAAGGAFPARVAEEPRPLGAKPGDFLVFAPKREFPLPGQIVPDVARVAVPQPAPGIAFDPFAPRVQVLVDRREADPLKEAARLLKLGREAFAVGEFGKAGDLFERAGVANPRAAEPHFLKAHAAFASGGFADAVAEIRAGLLLDPEWPAGTFDPKEPYGVNAAGFAVHLAELRRVVAANPGEAALEFLLGYELWFIGERVEAKKWFDAAEKRLDAPGPIALFK